MDIEWAYEKEKLYLLQARPITTYIPLHPAMVTRPGEKKRFYVDVLLAKQGVNTVLSVSGLDFFERTQRYFFEDMMGRDVIGLEDGFAFNIGGKSYQNQGNFMKLMGRKVAIKQWKMSDDITADVLEKVDISEYIPNKTPKKLKGLMFSMIIRNLGTMIKSRKAYKTPKLTLKNFQATEKDYFIKFADIEREYKTLSVNSLFAKLVNWNVNLMRITLIMTYAAGFAESAIKKVLKRLDNNQLLAKDGKRTAEKFKADYNALVELLGSREVPKYYMIMVASLLRKKLLCIADDMVKAKRLNNRENIFNLNFNQIDVAVEDSSLNLIALIKKNTEFTETISHIDNFPHVIDSRGKILRPPARPAKNGEIQGEPISAGTAVGEVKVLNTPDEKPILPGDILVARATDPGWTPLFINAGGIVLEVGGVLQHGALVAREYGKPCVAGIENATSVLKDGMIIEVDGTKGIIRETK